MRNLEDPTQEFENFLPMEDSRRWSQLVEFTTNQRNKSWKVVRNVLREYHSLLLSETFDIWYWQWWHLTSPFKENRLILGSDFEFFKSLESLVIFGKSLLDWIKVTKIFFFRSFEGKSSSWKLERGERGVQLLAFQHHQKRWNQSLQSKLETIKNAHFPKYFPNFWLLYFFI